MKKTFLLEYTVYNVLDEIIAQGKMKIKKVDNSLIAKIQLEKVLRAKYKYFRRMTVESCVEDDDILNGLFDIFHIKK